MKKVALVILSVLCFAGCSLQPQNNVVVNGSKSDCERYRREYVKMPNTNFVCYDIINNNNVQISTDDVREEE